MTLNNNNLRVSPFMIIDWHPKSQIAIFVRFFFFLFVRSINDTCQQMLRRRLAAGQRILPTNEYMSLPGTYSTSSGKRSPIMSPTVKQCPGENNSIPTKRTSYLFYRLFRSHDSRHGLVVKPRTGGFTLSAM